MMLLTIDAGTQLIALILNALLAGAGLLILWLFRLLYRATKDVLADLGHLKDVTHHLDECFDRTQSELRQAIASARDESVKGLAELKTEVREQAAQHGRVREEIAYLKALVNIPLDQPVGDPTRSVDT